MKKRIQKYLSGSNEGFSLVELIIVIAIMAILVGVVALAVIPNLERSRESKDLSTLDSACSALSIAVANAGAKASDGTITIDSTGSVTDGGATDVRAGLDEQIDLAGLKLTCGVANGANIVLEWKTTNGQNVVKAYAEGTPSCKYAKDDAGNLATLEVVGSDASGAGN